MKSRSWADILIAGLFVFGLFFVIAFFNSHRNSSPTVSSVSKPPQKIKIVTTLFPLYDMARYVGGASANVTLLLPPGMEAHNFEPKPSDIVKINEADVFVYTGKFMEPWAEDVIKSVNNKNLIVVDASLGVKMIPGVASGTNEPAGVLDPHIWLDFDNAKIMVENIAQAMESKALDPNAYELKAADYENNLAKFDLNYQNGLANCYSKEIVYGGHYALGYLAGRYGLKYTAAQGVSPDAEPTAKDLIALVNQIKRDKIKYVFYEELTSPKIAETIANETGAKVLALNAAHNLSKDDFASGVSFFDILISNLISLKTGLGCK